MLEKNIYIYTHTHTHTYTLKEENVKHTLTTNNYAHQLVVMIKHNIFIMFPHHQSTRVMDRYHVNLYYLLHCFIKSKSLKHFKVQ
jgi:sulfur relay (sulfurtransferase) DsrF/TusC family protein